MTTYSGTISRTKSAKAQGNIQCEGNFVNTCNFSWKGPVARDRTDNSSIYTLAIQHEGTGADKDLVLLHIVTIYVNKESQNI